MSTVWILFILAICGISLVFNIFSYTKHNAKLAKFTEEHPQAAKVSVKANKIGIIVENLNVLSVNGEQPLIYQEKLINTGLHLIIQMTNVIVDTVQDQVFVSKTLLLMNMDGTHIMEN